MKIRSIMIGRGEGYKSIPSPKQGGKEKLEKAFMKLYAPFIFLVGVRRRGGGGGGCAETRNSMPDCQMR